MGRHFKSKTKNKAEVIQFDIELTQALKALNLDENQINYIKEPLQYLDYSYLYQRILHLFLLNPKLRNNAQGEDLRNILFKCWLILFRDESTRFKNEEKLKNALSVLPEYYSIDLKLKKEHLAFINKRFI